MDGPDSSGDERNEWEMRDEMIGGGMREGVENRRQRQMEVKRSLKPRGWTGYLSDYLTALKDSLCNSDLLRGGSRLKVCLRVETRPVTVTHWPKVSVRTELRCRRNAVNKAVWSRRTWGWSGPAMQR